MHQSRKHKNILLLDKSMAVDSFKRTVRFYFFCCSQIADIKQ